MDGLSRLLPGRRLLETEGDAAAREVVRGQFDLHTVTRKNPDVVLAHLPGDLREHGLAALELDAEHRARQGLDHLALDLDLLFLDCQPTPRAGLVPCPSWVFMRSRARREAEAAMPPRGPLTVAD